MDSKLINLINLINDPDSDALFSHWDILADKKTLNELPVNEWLKIIVRKPKWWIFRGPFSTEAYREQDREQLIEFLLNHPDIADIYFSNNGWPHWSKCKPIQEDLKTDPRIIALIMMLI